MYSSKTPKAVVPMRIMLEPALVNRTGKKTESDIVDYRYILALVSVMLCVFHPVQNNGLVGAEGSTVSDEATESQVVYLLERVSDVEW
jgi:hypothetical protein